MYSSAIEFQQVDGIPHVFLLDGVADGQVDHLSNQWGDCGVRCWISGVIHGKFLTPCSGTGCLQSAVFGNYIDCARRESLTGDNIGCRSVGIKLSASTTSDKNDNENWPFLQESDKKSRLSLAAIRSKNTPLHVEIIKCGNALSPVLRYLLDARALVPIGDLSCDSENIPSEFWVSAAYMARLSSRGEYEISVESEDFTYIISIPTSATSSDLPAVGSYGYLVLRKASNNDRPHMSILCRHHSRQQEEDENALPQIEVSFSDVALGKIIIGQSARLSQLSRVALSWKGHRYDVIGVLD